MNDPSKMKTNEEAILTTASRALFHLGRTFSKLPMRQSLLEQSVQSVELSQILVVQAIEGATENGQAATVGDVAAALAIDPSTASRLVAQSIRTGYLTRVAAQHDGRAVHLALTTTGRTLADHAHHYQRAVFAQVTGDWSAEERYTFARLFVKFADAVTKALETHDT